MKIIFVRHANSVNDKLTCLGVRQAKMACEDLYYENITKVYASPFGRTSKTADIIAKKLHLGQVELDDRIAERDTDKDGIGDDELIEYNDNYLNPNYSHTKPEGCKNFLDRVFSFLDDVIRTNDDGTDKSILVVGHSSLSYAMYAYFYGVHNVKELVWTRIGNANKLAFQTADKKGE